MMSLASVDSRFSLSKERVAAEEKRTVWRSNSSVIASGNQKVLT